MNFLYDRGDNVNGYDPQDRTPDPERLLGQDTYTGEIV